MHIWIAFNQNEPGFCTTDHTYINKIHLYEFTSANNSLEPFFMNYVQVCVQQQPKAIK